MDSARLSTQEKAGASGDFVPPASPSSRHWPPKRPRALLVGALLLLLLLVGSHTHGVLPVAIAPKSHVDEWLASGPPNNGTVQFEPSAYSPILRHRPLEETLSVKGFSPACADRWISLGELCPDLKDAWAGDKGPRLEIVYAWTNGSASERMSQWRQAAGNLLGRRFRDHDELRYSLRSATTAFDPAALRAVHLVVSDNPACSTTDMPCLAQPSLAWEAQVPHWINLSEINFAPPSELNARQGATSETRLVVQPLTALFKRRPIDLTFESDQSVVGIPDALETQWRNRVLPSFNSLSVESQMANIVSSTDTLLYLNDDAFILRKLAFSDVASPISGPVLRMSRVTRLPGIAPKDAFEGGDSEWRGLHFSNWLLDQRFGNRSRSYLVHQAKSISLPILREAQGVFVDQLTATAASHFRGQAPLEVVTLFLSIHYQIEKHREALLWSFFFGRSDLNQDGVFSQSERAALLAELDFTAGSSTIRVFRPIRTSVCGFSDIYDHAGLERPKETSLLFTSADGFAGFVSPGVHLVNAPWPTFHDQGSTRRDVVCEINVEACFGAAFTSSSFAGGYPVVDAFRRVAHTNPLCGDCIIVQLISKSGSKGLSAFLPRPATHSTRRRPSTAPEVAAVGLGTSTHDLLDFSLPPSFLSIRERCVALIQRYSYTLGESPSTFIQGVSPQVLKDVLKTLEDEERWPPFLTINDDLPENASDSTIQAFDVELHRWFSKHFGKKTRWEL